MKKEVEKHGLDVSKPEEFEGRNVALSSSAAATKEAGKTAPASGNRVGVASVQSGIASADKAPESKFYTVRLGDTLWKIAETEYGRGHGDKYHLIIEANKPLLSHPDKLYPGPFRHPGLSDQFMILKAAGFDVCYSASVGRGNYGLRIGLHALHSIRV